MNNITIELCTEDRARIDALFQELVNVRRLLAGTEQLTPEEAPKTTILPKPEAPKAAEPVKPAEAPKAETPKQAAPEPAPEAPAPKTEAAPEAPEVTVAELQAKVVQLVNAGKKAETREIILKYAQNVGSIPEDKRAEVLELLNGLEG